MAVKIRLKRLGKVRQPFYRIIVTDAHTKRDGRAIEEIGKYAPKEEPSFFQVNSERVQHWLALGAQPTEPVQAILRKTGDWQRFKGQPLPEPVKAAEAKPDKKAVFEAAAREAQAEAETAEAEKGSTKSGGKRSARRAARDSGSGETAATPGAEAGTPAEGPPTEHHTTPEPGERPEEQASTQEQSQSPRDQSQSAQSQSDESDETAQSEG